MTKEKEATECKEWARHGYLWVQPGRHADKAAARRAAKAAKRHAEETQPKTITSSASASTAMTTATTTASIAMTMQNLANDYDCTWMGDVKGSLLGELMNLIEEGHPHL